MHAYTHAWPWRTRSLLHGALFGCSREGWCATRHPPHLAQAYRVGQYNVKGAYPFHFHFAGDASASAVTDCSVYK